jgi:two-component system, chemotaxis family, chemotaxis protein CheY
MGKKVLVVDSSLYNRMLLKDILIPHGYSVAEVSTGEEAVDAYERLRPDLVTIDANAPGINGVRTVRDITTKDPHASVLMCGTRGQRRAVMEGMSVGAVGVLLKPFTEKQVLREIRQAAGRPPTNDPMA